MPLPAGYFYKDGAYWGNDGSGPYAYDGASTLTLLSGASGFGPQTFAFSGAGTYIIANGPATAYSIFLTSSAAAGTVRIYDNTAASGIDVLGSTATAAASNVAIPVGAAPAYGVANTGLCLVVTGANVGYVVWGETQ